MTSQQPSRAALVACFAAGAGVSVFGMPIAPLVIIVLTLALVVGGDVVASRAPHTATPTAVHLARATAAGLGVVAVAFVLFQVLDY